MTSHLPADFLGCSFYKNMPSQNWGNHEMPNLIIPKIFQVSSPKSPMAGPKFGVKIGDIFEVGVLGFWNLIRWHCPSKMSWSSARVPLESSPLRYFWKCFWTLSCWCYRQSPGRLQNGKSQRIFLKTHRIHGIAIYLAMNWSHENQQTPCQLKYNPVKPHKFFHGKTHRKHFASESIQNWASMICSVAFPGRKIPHLHAPFIAMFCHPWIFSQLLKHQKIHGTGRRSPFAFGMWFFFPEGSFVKLV